MNYPYITSFVKFKNQIILEGCCNTKNFKVLIKDDNLFDEIIIEYQYTSKNDKPKLMTFFELLEKDCLKTQVFTNIYFNLSSL
mgnify:CR=1 FL=1|tara:strand:+ start:136 stop:384 length:249 start_codon:yes stop_codon:yes gene_type:complete